MHPQQYPGSTNNIMFLCNQLLWMIFRREVLENCVGFSRGNDMVLD